MSNHIQAVTPRNHVALPVTKHAHAAVTNLLQILEGSVGLGLKLMRLLVHILQGKILSLQLRHMSLPLFFQTLQLACKPVISHTLALAPQTLPLTPQTSTLTPRAQKARKGGCLRGGGGGGWSGGPGGRRVIRGGRM